MNWEAVGAVAESTGAVAVIVTLIYLSLQMRQNSRLLKASLATSTRESTNQITGLLASDREALRVFTPGYKVGKLWKNSISSILTRLFHCISKRFCSPISKITSTG